VTSSGSARYWAPLLFVSAFLGLLPSKAHSQQFTVAPSALGFGNVPLGSSQTQTLSITNTGSRSVTISRILVNGTGYSLRGLSCPCPLYPRQTAHLKITFTPHAVGIESGSVLVNASLQTSRRLYRWKTETVALSGSGVSAAGRISASPVSLSFGNLPPGGSQSLTEILTNTESTSVTISQVSMSSGAFTVSGLSLPLNLGAGQSLTFSVVFTPTVSGAISGNLAILSNASDPQLNIALSGSGNSPGQLSLVPAALNFGSVSTGSRAALNGTLTVTGSSVTISSGTSTSAEFVLSGISFPATLAVGQSVPFTVTFLPQTSGAAVANLSLVSNAANSPVTASLSGSGVSPIQHSVNLSWKASSNVVGYNVYRSGVSGGPYATMASANLGITYVDGSVQPGQTYYYVVTALDAGGAESVYSNQVQAVIPSP
jgi:hypothetical protein